MNAVIRFTVYSIALLSGIAVSLNSDTFEINFDERENVTTSDIQDKTAVHDAKREAFCNPPPIHDDATISGAEASEYALDTEITYKCKVGNVLDVTQFSSTCKYNERSEKAEWTDPKITCPSVPTCGSPPEREFAEIASNEISVYPLNTEVTYKCKYGYVSDVGQHTAKCEYNEESDTAEWTDPDFSCKPRSCGDPGFLENGRSIGHLFTFPNKVVFECYEGYKLIGLNMRYCQTNGLWSGDIPVCIEVQCSLPVNPENGVALFDSLHYGAELKYKCDRGFILSHKETRLCSENGTWSQTIPTCTQANCEKIEAPEHGFVHVVDNPKAGSIASFSCEFGRKMEGSANSKCTSTGEWTFPPPKCLSVCGVPEVEYGYMQKYKTISDWGYRPRKVLVTMEIGESIDHGETAYFRCYTGFIPIDITAEESINEFVEVICINGEWSRLLNCRQKVCIVPNVENGVVKREEYASRLSIAKITKIFSSGDEIGDRERVVVECNPGYAVASNSPYSRSQKEIVCYNEEWSTSVECKPDVCIVPDIENAVIQLKDTIAYVIPNTKILQRGETVANGGKVTVRCNPGYAAVSSLRRTRSSREKEITCNKEVWSDSVECKPDVCIVPDIRNGVVKKESSTLLGKTRTIIRSGEKVDNGGKVIVICDHGYSAAGISRSTTSSREKEIVCNNEIWSDSVECTSPADSCSGDPPKVPNGDAVVKERRHGHSIFYTCRKVGCGKISGNVTCIHGEWRGPPPKCLCSSCDIKDLEHSGLKKPEKTTYRNNEYFFPDCEEGYELTNERLRIECKGGFWVDGNIPCKEVFCNAGDLNYPGLNKPTETMYRNNGGFYAACKEGYELTSDRLFMKCEKGRWVEGGMPCKKAFCNTDDLKYPGLKKPSQEMFQDNDEFFPVCEEGYEITHETLSMKCEKGRWLYDGIPCKEASCQMDPPAIAHGMRIISDRSHNSTAVYQCYQGYILNGSSTVRCLFGNWEENAPECVDGRLIEDSVSRHTTTDLPVGGSTDKPRYFNTSLPDEDCSCILGYKDLNVSATINGKELNRNDNIPFASSVTFKCPQDLHLTWSNGLRVFGPVHIQCDWCAVWKKKDVPVCSTGNAAVEFLSDVKILRGGIITVKEKHNFSMSCISSFIFQPKLFVDSSCLQLETFTELKNDRYYKEVVLDIVEIDVTHNRKYECYFDDNSTKPSIVHLRVVENSCDLILPPEEVRVNYSDGTKINSVAQFKCPPFKKLQGPRRATCLSNGKWSNKNFPTCINITCPEINQTPFLEILYSKEQNVNSYAWFSCKENLQLSGEKNSKCLKNGTWSKPPPLCINKFVKCPLIQGTENYKVVYSNQRLAGSKVTFSCKDFREELDGPDTLTCYSDGKWSDFPPLCKKKYCHLGSLMNSLPEEVVPEGEEFEEYYDKDSELTLTCEGSSSAYVLVGREKAKCVADDKWEFGDAECIKGCSPVSSEDPMLIIKPEKKYYRFGDIIDFTCHDDLTLSSDVVRIMCIDDGWSHPVPTCVAEFSEIPAA